MRRFWIVLLSLGLIIAFNTSAFAVDTQFSGEFFMQGWYNKNASLIDKDSTVGPGNRGSTAFYTERLRVGIDFNVAKGLKLGTRFDALDRKWMAARRTVATAAGYDATDQEAENIAFDVAYVQFFTPIGLFVAGNAPASQFGTPLSDAVGYEVPVITWTYFAGPWIMGAGLKKSTDGYLIGSTGFANGGNMPGIGTDNDTDTYSVFAIYKWNTGSAGATIGEVFSRTANLPITSTNVYSRKTDIPYVSMYVMNKFGKLYVEDELGCVPFGHYLAWNEPFPKTSPYYPAIRNVDADLAFTEYFNINIDLAPAKVGFLFVWSRGDDPETMDKKEGGFRSVLDIDRSFNPCLILFNEQYMRWMSPTGNRGAVQSGVMLGNVNSANGVGTYVQNVWLYQLYGEYNVTPKLNLGASYTYAYADKKPTDNGYDAAHGGKTFLSDKYGSELDFTMKYKIYDNLEYMIGAAYFWTGDYFKGTNANAKLSNTYLLTHKLTLTF